MARSLNKVILIGNVGSDPEIRAVGSGSRVAQFSLATGYRKKDGTDVTQWHRIVVWERANAGGGDPFNVVERFVKKGGKVYVEGEIEYRSYEDKDGVTKYITEIRLRELLLLDGKGEGGGGGDYDRGSRPASSSAPARKSGGGSDYDDFQAGSLNDDDDLPF
jgi:single-strand DNA-binding protein